MTTETPATTFAELGVSEQIVSALMSAGIETAFPIQTATIRAAIDGRDICGKAPTGSGKTLAFGIPAIELSSMGTPWHPAVLILSPTRELATQIKDELEPLAAAKDRSIMTVFGGTNIERDIKRLEKGVDILVACPGRLEDLIGRRCCDLRNVEIAIVDEADRMADMGFLPAVKRILDQTPGNRHTLLFSATLDGDVDMLIKRYQNDPLTFEVDEPVGELGDVEHSWYLVQPVDRIPHAIAVLQRYESSIVFCRTRKGCDRVAKVFAQRGLSAVAIHGDRSQHQRERALADFTTGKAQVLVATDVAARGIHVDNVALVMHYDPAGSDKDYIHRSGRTGRAGQDGHVISMVVEDKKKAARQLQKDLGIKPGLEVLDVAALGPIVKPPKPKQPAKPERTERENDERYGRNRDRNERSDRSSRGAETAETGTEAARAVVRATAAVVPAKAEVLTVTAAETELAPAVMSAAVALPNETAANAVPTENARSLAEAKTIGTQRATTRTRNVRLVQLVVTATTVGTATTSPKIGRPVVVTRRRRRAATQRAVTPTRTPPRTRANAVTLDLVNWVGGG